MLSSWYLVVLIVAMIASACSLAETTKRSPSHIDPAGAQWGVNNTAAADCRRPEFRRPRVTCVTRCGERAMFRLTLSVPGGHTIVITSSSSQLHTVQTLQQKRNNEVILIIWGDTTTRNFSDFGLFFFYTIATCSLASDMTCRAGGCNLWHRCSLMIAIPFQFDLFSNFKTANCVPGARVRCVQ